MLQPSTTSGTAATSVRARLETRIAEALQPDSLEVIDESHLHAGHAGWRPHGETHMRVKVVAAAFTGKSRVVRHRMLNELAAAELAAGLHALAVEARAPDEALPDRVRPAKDAG